ncbi:MAG: L-threonylcarbamoyladenylate synthase [Verrucomicrobiota bacterium]
METTLLPTDTPELAKEANRRAVDLLHRGEVVALPTETVYGLAANGENEDAVAKIFAAKDRPKEDPLILHLPHAEYLSEVAEVPEEISGAIGQLTQAFWPGPLTLILPKHPRVSPLVTAGRDTVAVRLSAHPIFSKIARLAGCAIAAPSANRFGRISPTSASAVLEELSGRIPLIVDGGACSCGLESTIIRVEPGAKTKPHFHLLRPGPITRDALKEWGKVILPKKAKPAREQTANAPESPAPAPQEAPGLFASHYAPATPLRLLASPDDFQPEPGKRYALLSYKEDPKAGYLSLHPWEEVVTLSPGAGKLAEAAVRLYFVLRQLDRLGVDEIIAEPVSEAGLGLAIMDRLRRASS